MHKETSPVFPLICGKEHNINAGQLRPADFICALCYKFFEHPLAAYRGAWH